MYYPHHLFSIYGKYWKGNSTGINSSDVVSYLHAMCQSSKQQLYLTKSWKWSYMDPLTLDSGVTLSHSITCTIFGKGNMASCTLYSGFTFTWKRASLEFSEATDQRPDPDFIPDKHCSIRFHRSTQIPQRESICSCFGCRWWDGKRSVFV